MDGAFIQMDEKLKMDERIVEPINSFSNMNQRTSRDRIHYGKENNFNSVAYLGHVLHYLHSIMPAAERAFAEIAASKS